MNVDEPHEPCPVGYCRCPEEWAVIQDWPDYEVSTHGRVRSLKRGAPRVLALHPNDSGYLRAQMYRADGKQVLRVHALVAQAFVGPRDDGMQIRHLDGEQTNNHLCNLRYGTASENVADMLRHGTHAEKRKTHCHAGHPFDTGNTLWRRDGKGRRCRACAAVHSRAVAVQAKQDRAQRRAERDRVAS